MDPAIQRRLTVQLRRELAAGPVDPSPSFAIPADRYRDPAICNRERSALFQVPRAVAASAAIEAGACVPIDIPGTSALLVRSSDGVLRAFANACRHRATRLVDAPCQARAFVCPYHGWTYDQTGALIHVPHADAFPGVDLATRGLIPLAVTESHGLVWLGGDGGAYLGGLAPDLAALGLERYTTWQSAHATRRCNWKLVIEAFLDGYHIRVLHRDSIYRFFLDAASVVEPVGQHIRALTARRPLREAPADLGAGDLGELGTPSYLIFPATIVIEHPGFVSVITVHPVDAETTDYHHMMLIPIARAGEVDHWTRSWELIEHAVFQREDLWVCEQIQRGLGAGSTSELLFGSLETAVAWFHAAIDAALGGDRDADRSGG